MSYYAVLGRYCRSNVVMEGAAHKEGIVLGRVSNSHSRHSKMSIASHCLVQINLPTHSCLRAAREANVMLVPLKVKLFLNGICLKVAQFDSFELLPFFKLNMFSWLLKSIVVTYYYYY